MLQLYSETSIMNRVLDMAIQQTEYSGKVRVESLTERLEQKVVNGKVTAERLQRKGTAETAG